MIKLNLGCWKNNFPGFINVDIAHFPHIHHQRAVDDLFPFEDNSVDLIYASHVFEYFTLRSATKALAEWRRVLRPDGVLTLAVPDFEGMVKIYQKTGRIIDLQGIIFGSMDVPGPDGAPVSLRHRTVYDFALLEKVLEENGFKNVRRYDWRSFLAPGQRDGSGCEIHGVPASLNVQADKASPLEHSAAKGKYFIKRVGSKIRREVKKLF